MSAAKVVEGKFRELLMCLGTLEGVEAVGAYLPIFVASLLDVGRSREIKEIGLGELVRSVRAHWDNLADYESATRQ